ncbi:MAG: HAD family hydrolase [Chloroflexi bacterium]|nr:HAD family hydrolase [Chloroflexota bacterium]
MSRAVFFDRDGVINTLVYRQEKDFFDSPFSLEEFQLLPGAAEGIRLVNELGMLAIVVSNQPGIAKGNCSLEMMEQMNEKMRTELAALDASLDAIYYCYHHPEGNIEMYRTVCQCRKPKPGLLLMAAHDFAIDLKLSYMIGDRLKDMQAGRKAGCKTIFLNNHPDPKEHLSSGFDYIDGSLLEAVRQIYQLEGKWISLSIPPTPLR